MFLNVFLSEVKSHFSLCNVEMPLFELHNWQTTHNNNKRPKSFLSYSEISLSLPSLVFLRLACTSVNRVDLRRSFELCSCIRCVIINFIQTEIIILGKCHCVLWFRKYLLYAISNPYSQTIAMEIVLHPIRPPMHFYAVHFIVAVAGWLLVKYNGNFEYHTGRHRSHENSYGTIGSDNILPR